VAARAVASSAPRPDDLALDLLRRAVSRYMKEAGKLADGGHVLPSAVINKIKRNGLVREALTCCFRALRNAESVGKYAFRATRVLNFARRAAEDDVTAILSGGVLRTEGSELNRSWNQHISCSSRSERFNHVLSDAAAQPEVTISPQQQNLRVPV
jgi:hypothetical protein